ncbi:hypothetical protein ABEB36_009513 [Hypothenemus hampei]|uniref:Uncharacterized protein n=1 Tax=Hypothenemus hampei TaxID=57062 RepID=A0ABD1EGK0_HYPHA
MRFSTVWLMPSQMSFIVIANKVQLRVEPCGTPFSSVLEVERLPPALTLKRLFAKNESTNNGSLPLIPNPNNFLRIPNPQVFLQFVIYHSFKQLTHTTDFGIGTMTASFQGSGCYIFEHIIGYCIWTRGPSSGLFKRFI